MQKKIDRLEAKIQHQLKALEERVPQAELAVPTISKWSIGEHIEHLALACARTGEGFARALQDDAPEASNGSPSLAARIVLWTGFIPRGKGKAPVAVAPRRIEADLLRHGLAKERQRLRELRPQLAALEATGWRLPHPIFGPLSPSQWLRFTEIHIRHHGKIIDDIAKATAG